MIGSVSVVRLQYYCMELRWGGGGGGAHRPPHHMKPPPCAGRLPACMFVTRMRVGRISRQQGTTHVVHNNSTFVHVSSCNYSCYTQLLIQHAASVYQFCVFRLYLHSMGGERVSNFHTITYILLSTKITILFALCWRSGAGAGVNTT